jgi:hypothetical protein
MAPYPLTGPAVAAALAVTGDAGRAAQAAMLRETFLELHDYLERHAEKKYEEKLEKEEREIDVTPSEARELGMELVKEEDLDDAHRNLYRLTRGRLPAVVYCRKAMDVPRAIELAEEHGFLEHTTFLLGPECFKAVRHLKKAGRPVILDANLVHRERHPITGEETTTFVPAAYAKAGIPFALEIDADSNAWENRLWYQAARCVAGGVPRETAIRAITTVPASILGMETRLGSIETGKDADILVLTGDPLDIDTRIEKVYVAGRLAYDIEKDPRLKRLLEGRSPDMGLEAGEPSGEGAAQGEEPSAEKPGSEAENKSENNED